MISSEREPGPTAVGLSPPPLPAELKAAVSTGADARQLWVKVNDNLAFVVAIDDRPHEEGARTIASYLTAAIR